MSSPPGPRGLPVVGSVRRFARDPFSFMTAVGEAYDGVAQFSLGPEEFYMLTDPADIERVLVNTEGAFEKASFGSDATARLLGTGLLLSSGATWRERRRMMQPAFSGDRMAEYADTMVDRASELVAAWEPGVPIDVNRELSRVTIRIILETMFGVRLEDRTIERVREALVPIGRRFEPDPVRAVLPDWVPTTTDRRFEEALDQLEAIVSGIAVEGANAAGDGPLMTILRDARKRGALSREDLRDELVTMLLAGHDTTALALTYVFHLLDATPTADERLAAEVTGVLDGSRPGYDRLDELVFTERVIKESLRLYPPVYAMFREPADDAVIGGYRIPAGSTLMLPQWVVHRDPRHYDAPASFDPDRWEPDRASRRASYAYFPFGGGPRSCIGRRFAMVEATLILATIASEYRLAGDGRSPELRASITMHPKEPIELTPVPR